MNAMGMTQGFAPARKQVAACEIVRTFTNESPVNSRIARVQQFPLFLGLSAAACGEIVSAAREKHFLRRQIIYFQDDPVDQVILLTSGAVKTTQLSSSGNEVILRLCGPGEIIGANGVLSGRYHRAAAQVLSASRALIWSTASFETLSGRYPALRHNACLMLRELLMDLEKRFCEIATESVSLRVGHEIARLANRIGERVNGHVKINLSREDIAQLTGTTLFTVSRLLSRWKAQGFVSPGHRSVTVHNPQALLDLTEIE
jgi:CRP-like cAMP-binding protein